MPAHMSVSLRKGRKDDRLNQITVQHAMNSRDMSESKNGIAANFVINVAG
jgi:hypothetical protein